MTTVFVIASIHNAECLPSDFAHDVLSLQPFQTLVQVDIVDGVVISLSQ